MEAHYVGRKFKDYPIDQPLLLSPDLCDWVPKDHLARFVAELIHDGELKEWYADYESLEGRGQPAYSPVMMARILFYGQCTGRFSSRKLERATYEDVAVRYLAAGAHPDHTAISRFRIRHIERIKPLFVRVIALAALAGMVKLGLVAIDGTKLAANASRGKTVEAGQMEALLAEAEQLVDELMEKSRLADEQEDDGETKLPAELAAAKDRLEKLKRAKEVLDERQQELAEEHERKQAGADTEIKPSPTTAGCQEIKKIRLLLELTQQQLAELVGITRQRLSDIERLKQAPGPELLDQLAAQLKAEASQLLVKLKPQKPGPTTKPFVPDPKLRLNTTDPDSRLMKPKDHRSSIQGYNCQLAVDGKAQIIVAAAVTSDPTDYSSFTPMIQQVSENCGRSPVAVTADAGYCSNDNLTRQDQVDLFVAPGPKARAVPDTPRDQMRQKLSDPANRAIYDKRAGIVEPVFAHIKRCLGFQQFLLRGSKKVEGEWLLVTAAHNILKLFRHSLAPR